MAKSRKNEVTVKQAGDAWLEHITEDGMVEGTVEIYRRDLETACAYFGEDRVINNIMPAHIGAYLKSNLFLKKANGKDRAKNTTDRTIRVLRMMLVWATEQGMVDANPCPKALLERKKREPKAIAGEVVADPAAAAAGQSEE